jgi:acyl carrier protein
VGYVVLEEGAEFNQGELRRVAAERLPEYMVPVVLVQLGELPLTALAKVDRQALPEIDSSSLESAQAFVEPRTPIEEMLVDIWSTTLKLDRVGAHDNFFELGGDSLLATQLIARVRERLQVEVALRELFEEPTVAGFGERVAAALRAGAGVSAPPLRRVERREEMVLSFAQQRLWFIEQLRPGSPLYNMPHAVRMLGRLNVKVLEQTVTEIVRRHEILRTTVKVTGGQPMQVVHPAAPVKLAIIDLSRVDQAEREEKALNLITQDSTQPFDLSRGPLLRVGVIKLAEDEHITFFTTHHIISDGWSVNLLIREVVALYTAFNNNESSLLPELPIQYADFSHWQREWLQGEVLARQVGYWREQLAGAPWKGRPETMPALVTPGRRRTRSRAASKNWIFASSWA